MQQLTHMFTCNLLLFPLGLDRHSPMWRRRSQNFCRGACEVEVRAEGEPAGLAPGLGHTRLPRGCLAQPKPTPLAALTVVVMQPGPETICWWVSV